jgi:hypothetical protein
LYRSRKNRGFGRADRLNSRRVTVEGCRLCLCNTLEPKTSTRGRSHRPPCGGCR